MTLSRQKFSDPLDRMRRVVFRTDASRAIGGGHVMRCLTLASHLKNRGWHIGFACSAETLAVVPRLQAESDILVLDHDPTISDLSRRWPGGCEVLVVDDYGLDAAFERAARVFAQRIVVIDDLANRPHDCDLIVDTTPGRTMKDYAGLIPRESASLFGPLFALLRSQFAEARTAAVERRAASREAKRVLVSLGLTDLEGITERVVRALMASAHIRALDVVIGAAVAKKDCWAALAAQEPRLTIHVDPSNMAPLMAAADLAIGAGGTTSWERCCLGLPTLLLVLAENQRMIARELAARGAALLAPLPEDPTFLAHVDRLLANLPRLSTIAKAAADITDGRGCERVAFAISRFPSLERVGPSNIRS